MSPASDNRPRDYNKIPGEYSQNETEKVDAIGWEDSILFPGTENGEQLYPHVRYGFIEEGEFTQGKLQPLSEPIPQDAITASQGIYFLTSREMYNISQGARAKTIQTNCEEDSRVAYTVVAESDALENSIPAQTVITWLAEFAESVLDINKNEYQLFYSGRRSIHLHTGYYVSHNGLKSLRDDVQTFNQEQSAELDVSIYGPKKQFRLNGACHRISKLFKVPIQRDAIRDDLVRNSQQSQSLSLPHSIPHKRGRNSLIAGNGSRGDIPQEYAKQLLPKYIKSHSSCDLIRDPDHPDRIFSPYAKTENGERSMCIIESIGGAYCPIDRDTRFLPCFVHGARGADGEYTLKETEALIRLSPHDYKKYNYRTGEPVVIIGGQSRKSRIFSIQREEVDLLKPMLCYTDRRDLAESLLRMREYDVGESGMNGSRRTNSRGQSAEIVYLQKDIKRGDINPTRNEVLRVSCSLLKTGGWKRAWDWNKEIWGHEFKPEVTYSELKGIVNSYPDQYGHIDVPPQSP